MEEIVEIDGKSGLTPGLVKKLDKMFADVKETSAMIQDAKERGDDAKDNISEIDSGFFHRKQAIEGLKDATIKMADIQNETLDIVETISENQQHLANLFQEFIKLGMVDIATNRAVVKYIKDTLSSNSDGNLSKEVSDQLKGVIKDLKQKEDLLIKQEKQQEKIKEHEKRLSAVEKEATSYAALIEKGDSKDNEQDIRLDSVDKKDIEQDKRLDYGDQKDLEQDKRLNSTDEKNKEQDIRLQLSEERDKEQDEVIDAMLERIDKCQLQIAGLQVILKRTDGLNLSDNEKNELDNGVRFLDDKLFDVINNIEKQQVEINKINDSLRKQNEYLNRQIDIINKHSKRHYLFESICMILSILALIGLAISLFI